MFLGSGFQAFWMGKDAEQLMILLPSNLEDQKRCFEMQFSGVSRNTMEEQVIYRMELSLCTCRQHINVTPRSQGSLILLRAAGSVPWWGGKQVELFLIENLFLRQHHLLCLSTRPTRQGGGKYLSPANMFKYLTCLKINLPYVELNDWWIYQQCPDNRVT